MDVRQNHIIGTAIQLLWALALADVENVVAGRTSLLSRLAVLELEARELGIPDLYGAAMMSVTANQPAAS